MLTNITISYSIKLSLDLFIFAKSNRGYPWTSYLVQVCFLFYWLLSINLTLKKNLQNNYFVLYLLNYSVGHINLSLLVWKFLNDVTHLKTITEVTRPKKRRSIIGYAMSPEIAFRKINIYSGKRTLQCRLVIKTTLRTSFFTEKIDFDNIGSINWNQCSLIWLKVH